MPAGINDISAGSWLELGIAGAALFIVLIVVLLMFKQQSKSVDKLCTKIDALVTSFSNNNLKLNEVLISNDRDQKEILHKLTEIHEEMVDMHKRVVRIDTRMYDQINTIEQDPNKGGAYREDN